MDSDGFARHNVIVSTSASIWRVTVYGKTVLACHEGRTVKVSPLKLTSR